MFIYLPKLMNFILHLKINKNGSKMVQKWFIFIFLTIIPALIIHLFPIFWVFPPSKKAWEMMKSKWKRLNLNMQKCFFYSPMEIILSSWVRTWEFVKLFVNEGRSISSNFLLLACSHISHRSKECDDKIGQTFFPGLIIQILRNTPTHSKKRWDASLSIRVWLFLKFQGILFGNKQSIITDVAQSGCLERLLV